MQVKFFAGLRDITGTKVVEVDTGDGATVGEALRKLISRYPDLEAKLFDEDGDIRTSVNVLLDGRNVKWLNGLDTELKPGQSLAIFPPIAGG